MINVLKEYKTKSIKADNNKSEIYIVDNDYRDFLENEDVGFYFNNTLHFFGNSNKFPFHSLISMNELIKNLYGEICSDFTFIGEDIFGNPFCYNKENYFYMFNIESGKFEEVAFGFVEFINKLKEDLEYWTGSNFLDDLAVEDIELLSLGNRYCPKLPFILGGEYATNNLVMKTYSENLEFSSSIYHQIKDLPDGTDFEIKIV